MHCPLPVLGLLVAGCGVPDFVPPEAPPEIVEFSAAPLAVTSGEAVEVRWVTRSAAQVQLLGVDPDPRVVREAGALTLRPQTSLELTLLVKNPAGSRRARIRLSLQTEAPVRFTALTLSPPRVRAFEATTLRWRTENARAAWLRVDGEGPAIEVAPVGRRVLRPRTAGLITLTAEGSPAAVTATVAVQIAPQTPVIFSFEASPSLVVPPEPALLLASFSGAERVQLFEIEPDGLRQLYALPGDAPLLGGSGDIMYDPGPREAGRHRFLLRVSGYGRSETAEAELAVQPVGRAQIEAFTVTPTITGPGGEVQVSWRTRNAASVYLKYGNAQLSDLRSGRTVLLTGRPATAPVSLRAVGVGGDDVDAAIPLTVDRAWPEIGQVDVQGPYTSGTATISWSTAGAARVELRTTAGAWVASATSARGSWAVPIERPTDLRFEALDGPRSTARSLRIVPGRPPRIEAFEVETFEPRAQRHVLVRWRVADADAVELHLFQYLSRAPAEGFAFVTADQNDPILSLRARNEVGEIARNEQVLVHSSFTGVEAEPNDLLSQANAAFEILPASVPGTLEPGDTDSFYLGATDETRPIVSLSSRDGCENLALQLWRDHGPAGPVGPLATVQPAGGCARLDPATAPQLSSGPGPYFVRVVRSFAGENVSTDYELSVLGVPRGCGDGVVDVFEDCDDGNRNRGDGCSSACFDEAVEEDEPNDVPELAGQWRGETFSGYRRLGDVDRVRFEVSQPGPHRIQLEAGSPCVAAALELYDARGQRRAHSDPETPCAVLEGAQMVLEAGLYELVVRDAEPEVSPARARGRYLLRRAP